MEDVAYPDFTVKKQSWMVTCGVTNGHGAYKWLTHTERNSIRPKAVQERVKLQHRSSATGNLTFKILLFKKAGAWVGIGK